MYRYRAFGLGVGSELPIPELLEGGSEIEVLIRLGQVDRTPPPGAAAGGWSEVHGDSAYLSWDGVGTFQVRGGTEITVDPEPGVSLQRVRLFLLGAALGTLLHQRGLLVLHGSAVSIDGAAVAFLGSKWCGKSTIAAVLNSRGHELVSDDVLAIEVKGARALVSPSFPQIKLWPESLSVIGERPSSVLKLHPELEKRDYRVDLSFSTQALPLHSIYLFGMGERPGIEALDAHDALGKLMTHWYCARFGFESLHALGISSHFLQSATLVNSTPFYLLRRPRDLAAMPDLANVVEKNLSCGPGHQQTAAPSV